MKTRARFYAKRIKGVITIYERLAKEVASALKQKVFPIILAGDHSSAGGTVAGIKAA